MKYLSKLKKLGLLMVALSLTIGCQGKSSSIQKPVVQTDPRQAVTAAYSELSKKIFRAQYTIQVGSQTDDMVIEFVPPDSYHMISRSGETISIGDKVYVKIIEQGVWEETDINPGEYFDVSNYAKIGDIIEDVQFISRETLNNISMLVYQYQITEKVDEKETTSVTKVWVSEKDGLPYKEVKEGYIWSMDMNTGTLEPVQATTTALYAYDQTISIKAPIP